METELMNSFVPFLPIHGNPEFGQREGVWRKMMGMKKKYMSP
jgi:hypothetical protein